MTVDHDFSDAQARVKRLSRQPATDELLTLYGLYKQATVGDVSGTRPGMLDFKGRAKYDAWRRHRGRDRAECRVEYVRVVDELVQKYGSC